MKKMLFMGPTFTLEVPTDWFVLATAQYQAVFSDPQEVDGFQANVAIAVRSVEAQVTVEAVAESAKQTQAKEYPAYQVIEEIISDQVPSAIRRTYVWRHLESDQEIKQTQFFYIVNGRLYTLTATRLANSANVKEVDAVVDHMINTFAIRTG
jgi:hypothetical protein